MAIFSSNNANFIQHISVIIEFIGLLLTFIEVFKPKSADKIEEKIDNTYLQTAFSIRKTFNNIRHWLEDIINPAIVVISTIVALILTIIIGNYLENYEAFRFPLGLLQLYLVGYLIMVMFNPKSIFRFIWKAIQIFLYAIFLLPLGVLRTCIYSLNKVTNGRAIGGIGVNLALFGFLCELFQIIIIYSN